MTTIFPITCVAIFGVSALVTWLLLMLWLRWANFEKGGQRKHDALFHDPNFRSQEIEYHNKATYSALEFYLKVLLAVLGGAAYLVLFHSPLKEAGRLLLVSAGWTVCLVTFLFCIMNFVHQKSKIQRWSHRYKWWEPFV